MSVDRAPQDSARLQRTLLRDWSTSPKPPTQAFLELNVPPT